MPVNLDNFGGMLPVADPSTLPNNYASYARNVWLYGHNLQGFRRPTNVHTLRNSAARSVYRISNSDTLTDDYSSSVWMEFEEDIVDVIKSPVIKDSFKRYYVFSPNSAPRYTTLASVQAGDEMLLLGVPTPELGPEVNCVGGTLTYVRSYLYTYVSEFGEEGQPSPPTTYTGTNDGTWIINVNPPSSDQMARRGLKETNIYRTITGVDGTSAYYLVGTIPITQSGYLDSSPDTDNTGHTILPSLYWAPPPEDLQGAVLMPGGILCGWRNKNELWFSEPYRPHAWPPQYAINIPHDIVCLGVTGNTVVVVTKGYPYAVTGLTPDTMTPSKITSLEPGASRLGVTSGESAVYFVSENGIVMATAGGTQNLTTAMIAPHQWQALAPESFMLAGRNTAITLMRRDAPAKNNGKDNGLYLEMQVPNINWTNIQTDSPVSFMSIDTYTSDILMVYGGRVWVWDDRRNDAYIPWVWRSKRLLLPFAQNYYGGKVFFTTPNWQALVPGVRNVSQSQDFNPSSQLLMLRVFGDGQRILVREIQKTGEMIVLPGLTKYDTYEFELEGQVTVYNVQFAMSAKELRAI